MVFIRYGHYIAAYDGRAWRSSAPGLAEMLNAIRCPDTLGTGEDGKLAVARHVVAALRAGEVIDVASGQAAMAGMV